MIRPLVVAVLLLVCASAVFSGCSSLPPRGHAERDALAAELGWDPAEQLAAIGAAPGHEAERNMARQLCRVLNGQHQLRLLRFGLGHTDERVVFGAVMLMGDSLPVPELKSAAKIVLPRLGEPDCPVELDSAKPLIGGADFAALVDVIPRLPTKSAEFFLGELHRMARADSVEALCTIALASEGEIRNRALNNAALPVDYGGTGPERLIATCLTLAGRTYDATSVDDRMPDMLRQALRLIAEPEAGPIPLRACARWLANVSPPEGDLPLLREMLSGPLPMPEAAAWAVGSLRSEAAAQVLAGAKPDGVTDATWLAARARNGDQQALGQLFEADAAELAFGMALASPARRDAFFAKLLALPEDAALDAIEALGEWVSGQVNFESWALPSCESAMLAGLEPMLAADDDVLPAVLRACVAHFSSCETVRLADAMLRRSPGDLLPDAEDVRFEPLHIGHGSVWGFLEVTRPDAFRSWLRRGLADEEKEVRDVCAALLIRLGDAERAEALLAWLDEPPSWLVDRPFARLARDRDPRVLELLCERVRHNDDALEGLAVALGVPFEFEFGFGRGESLDRDLLLAGDVAAAFLATQDDVSVAEVGFLFEWGDPRVLRFLHAWRASIPERVESLYRFDQARELASGDPARVARALQPLCDGRYATHGGMSPYDIAAAGGISLLPFLVEAVGTNCCKSVLLEEVLVELFGEESGAYGRERLREPAASYLRRTLLPVVHRLRFSRIADAYVVAGN